MKRGVPIALGVVMIIAGFVLWGQGLGAIEGSPMTGSKFWAYAGPLIAGFGVALIMVTLQRRR
ncbi:hypothetical protein BJ980_000554 [Nocardioides daedukensis]|uniref:Integral membrane protein n=1 Tax=Nocardioides daedukensis TaxID=634462 RepID=A0A7Y9RYA7_9ACTN|nr:hypothetical protein [Nocardioides daedukensis]NYG57631.1 hypothetical protein [Nocardioides daedukensis]